MEELHTSTAEETRDIGSRIARRLPPDAVVLLTGDLGAGKTVLAQGVAAGLGFDPSQVQSPSYTLIREHEAGGRRLVHVDLYRLDAGDLATLGLEEVLAGEGLKVVEWAERVDFPVTGAWRIQISRPGPGEDRLIEIEQPNDNGEES
ncbi:MAG: tRNA (adenosine(37)-N6)-threonylcarbamoyltransferase complex ATPase subunit type 1 TsaE [Acidobacteriota bacterium]|nr:tRNA (adenosine(37)-N6)-threonylcarbamoyltransferase complex ATPase subunit type 1 TsaE [Acidobacteriota bacterium]